MQRNLYVEFTHTHANVINLIFGKINVCVCSQEQEIDLLALSHISSNSEMKKAKLKTLRVSARPSINSILCV